MGVGVGTPSSGNAAKSGPRPSGNAGQIDRFINIVRPSTTYRANVGNEHPIDLATRMGATIEKTYHH